MNSQRIYKIKKWLVITIAIISLFSSLLLCYATVLFYKSYCKTIDSFQHFVKFNNTQLKKIQIMVSLHFNF